MKKNCSQVARVAGEKIPMSQPITCVNQQPSSLIPILDHFLEYKLFSRSWERNAEPQAKRWKVSKIGKCGTMRFTTKTKEYV